MFDVAVVGAGLSGLSCAIRLQQAGARVVVVAADEPQQTVSAVAAAVWYPTRTAADPRVLRWAGRTFDELADQAARGIPGVTMRPTRMLLRGSTETPWWAAAVPDFRHAPPATSPSPYTGEWHFTVPSVEMPLYLDWLVEQVTEAGGTHADLGRRDLPLRLHLRFARRRHLIPDLRRKRCSCIRSSLQRLRILDPP